MKGSRSISAFCLTITAIVAIGVSACASGDNKTVETIPVPKAYVSGLLDSVSYPEGKPAGKYEGDPWVRVARSYETEDRWAKGRHDWTSPNLLMVADEQDVVLSASGQIVEAEQGVQKWQTPAGPRPFRVLSIGPWDSGRGANVTVCQAYYWYMSSTNEAPVLEADGRQVEYLMTIDEEDGYGKVVAAVPDDDKPCSVEGIVPSYFDPLPTYTEISPDDVKITPWIEKELDRSK